MREIVLDTETTGLDPLRGDRLVEIGCVEIFNRMPTGQTFHRHLNPEREMSAEAFAVHGLSSEFLADKPFFAEVAEEFLEFIADAPLVIHNASFDQTAPDSARAAGRHAAAGAAQASRRVEPARRSLLTLCDR
jgi:DNA polymerase-3 subunit epsilon